MASSGGEIPGLVPEKGELIPPGKPMSTEQQLLDQGAQMMQSLNPVNQINQHVCTFALYSQDLTRQIETHHYVTRLNQDFIQCAVYDTDDSHGRLIDGHILAHILAATSIGVISAIAFHYYHRQKPQKQVEDQTVVPLLDRNESGRVAKLERFSNYVARQIGFEDGSECPQLCKLANEYLKKSKGCESIIYEYFVDEPNVDELYVKLVEEFDRFILAYFAFHWSQASLMISQISDLLSPPISTDSNSLCLSNSACEYTAFDKLKRRLLKRQLSKKRGTEPSSEALSVFSAFVLGAVSKCIATCLTYPAIRCKVTIQAKSDEDEIKEDQPKAQKTVSGAIHTIWKREGLLGFFKGLRAQILKTVLSSALLMMVKEKITKTTWVLMLALQRYLSITKTRLKNA